MVSSTPFEQCKVGMAHKVMMESGLILPFETVSTVCLRPSQYYNSDQAWCEDCPESGSLAPIISVGVFIVLSGCLLYWLHEQDGKRFEKCSLPLRRWVHAIRTISRSIGMLAKIKTFLTFTQVVSTLERTYAIGLPESW